MKKAVPLVALILSMTGVAVADDLKSRITYGSGTYEAGKDAAVNYEYDKAEDYFLKVIETGPTHPDYFKAGRWLTKKLPKHKFESYLMITAVERAAANILLDKAEKLDSEIEKLKGANPNDPKIAELETQKKTLLTKAKNYLDSIKIKEEESEKAYTTLTK